MSGKTQFLMIILLLSVSSLLAAPPVDFAVPSAAKAARSLDTETYFNANYLLMFVENNGNICNDYNSLFCRSEGFYYPYTGDQVYPGNKTCVYSAGLWLGGKVDGETRVAVAEYTSEFVPGPIVGGQPQPDDPSFRVYKIDASSGPGDPDYDEWPASQGAPVDGGGNPLLTGDQTLWSVCNDAEPSAHTRFGTNPLGIEVRQTTWGSAVEGEQIVVYVKYLLYNKGGNDIDSCYVSFWADPDLGDPGDDLVGCDSTASIFFCYNSGSDIVYGIDPPAWGGKLLSGPLVPSPGDTAEFDGTSVPDYRNLPMTAYAKYITGLEPYNSSQAYDFMKGLQMSPTTGMMEPAVDPTTGEITTFVLPGDPVTMTGWIDSSPDDRRLMITTGPFDFPAGDSQQVVIKLAVDAGGGALNAITKLKHTLNYQAADIVFDPIIVAPADSVQSAVTDYGHAVGWYWNSSDSRWITGYDWGGSTFFGSVDNGNEFFGSSITDASQLHNVEIRFSNTSNTQMGYRYVRSDAYNYGGYHEVPLTVWDVDENRQLNVAFVEDETESCYDFTWGPCDDEIGGREYLFILNSDYSPTEDPAYTENLFDVIDAGNWDNLYAWWPRLRTGLSLSDLADGQTLGFFAQRVNQNGLQNTVILATYDDATNVSQEITLYCFVPGNTILTYSTDESYFTASGCEYVGNYDTTKVVVTFTPPGRGTYEGNLIVTDLVAGQVIKQVHLIGCVPSGVCGDANCDGVANITDVVYLISYIFAGGPAPFPIESGDVNCDGIANITDGVYLIAYIFAGGPAPCADCP